MKTKKRKKSRVRKSAARKSRASRPSPAPSATGSTVVLHYWPHVLQVEVNNVETPHRRVLLPSDLLVARTEKAWNDKGAKVTVRKFTDRGEEIPFSPPLL